MKEEKPGASFANRGARALALLIRVALGVLLLLVAGVVGKMVVGGGAVPIFIKLLNSVQGIGPWGVPLLIACEAAAFLLLVPISPLHVGMGFIYGPFRGLLLAWTAYAIGCVPPFLLVRVPILSDRFSLLRRRMDVLDGVFSAVEFEPFKLIVCLRLSPLLPSPLNSYLLGFTNVPLRTYVAASVMGSLPNLCVYVYLGTLLDSLSDIASGRVRRSPLTWAMLITGCVATVGGIAYVSRIATRRINAAAGRRAADEAATELAPHP